MGTDVKLLSAACKLSGTSCISSFSPPPCSCAVNKNISGGFIHVLAVSAFIQAHSIPGTTFVPHSEPLHFIPLSFYAFNSAPRSFGSLLPFHSASSINPVSHYPSHFPTHFQWYVLFSAAS